MKRVKYIILGMIIALVGVWVSALVKCEVLTHAHYDEFKDAYTGNTMLSDIEYFKVLSYEQYKDGIAQVYYVSKGNAGADVLTFKYDHESRSWKEIAWSTIWSKGGSASDVIWPYWWHFVYGGF